MTGEPPGSDGEQSRQHSLHTDSLRHRGQIEPQNILRVAVLFMIAGPLVAAGVQLQAGLVSAPAFSWGAATIVAVLFVVAIAAAVLGDES